MKSKYKLPQKGGAKKLAEHFQKTKKKVPSDRLVKIISEVPEISSETSETPTLRP